MAAAAVVSSATHRHNDIFFSVFPKTDFTTPTPEATPNIGAISSPGRPFGGFNVSGSFTDDAVKYNRSWSAATRYLSLPPGFGGKVVAIDSDILRAFSLILESSSVQKDILSWYANEISHHFRIFVLPELASWQQPVPISDAFRVLQSTVLLLQQAQRHYLTHVDNLAANTQHTSLRDPLSTLRRQVKQNLHTIVLHSLPRQRLQKTLTSVIFHHLIGSLQQTYDPEKCAGNVRCHCQPSLEGLPLDELYDVGLGATLGERAFAHAVHKFLQGPAIERRCFEVDWNGHLSVVPKLRVWVEENLSPIFENALSSLIGNPALKFSVNDVQQFVDSTVANLGRLRTHSLFDYVKSWPASSGAVLDIWEYLSAGSQSDKAHVCQSFSNQIQKRLLHAGASTSEILSIYVNVIHAFKSLDSRGVLLEKVALPIRNYLRAREDTVSIIAASFLADVEQDDQVASTDVDKTCPDITIEVANSTLEDRRDGKALNWDDMQWMPDPIDAGPDYKSSKSEDTIAYILGLFEQEEFIKEVTTVLAQHLLHSTDSEYVKETRLVELFKSRLDASKLQAAEVMLKDVRDSVSLGKRINPFAGYDSTGQTIPTPKELQAAIPEEGITLPSLWRGFEGRMKRAQFVAALKLVANKRNDLFYPKRTRIPHEPSTSSAKKKDGEMKFTAQILSSFFWPQLRSNEFDMPRTLAHYPAGFENRFNTLGSQRKLQFRPALARVSLRLDLEDRSVEEFDIPGWRASVIDAFASERAQKDDNPTVEYTDDVGLTPEQLAKSLSMEEELVQDALNFWTNKNVLYQPTPGTYAVLERLDILDSINQTQLIQHGDTISAVMSQDAMLRESAPMFSTFIANMLRNQGPKQIGGMMGITSLLKMVLPAFTYGDDEVAWLLGQMEGRGEVRRNGDMWLVAN